MFVYTGNLLDDNYMFGDNFQRAEGELIFPIVSNRNVEVYWLLQISGRMCVERNTVIWKGVVGVFFQQVTP